MYNYSGYSMYGSGSRSASTYTPPKPPVQPTTTVPDWLRKLFGGSSSTPSASPTQAFRQADQQASQRTFKPQALPWSQSGVPQTFQPRGYAGGYDAASRGYNTVSNAANQFANTVSRLPGQASSIGSQIIDGVKSGVNNYFQQWADMRNGSKPTNWLGLDDLQKGPAAYAPHTYADTYGQASDMAALNYLHQQRVNQAYTDRLMGEKAAYDARPKPPIGNPGGGGGGYGYGYGWGGGGGGGGGGGSPAGSFYNNLLNWRVLEVQGG